MLHAAARPGTQKRSVGDYLRLRDWAEQSDDTEAEPDLDPPPLPPHLPEAALTAIGFHPTGVIAPEVTSCFTTEARGSYTSIS